MPVEIMKSESKTTLIYVFQAESKYQIEQNRLFFHSIASIESILPCQHQDPTILMPKVHQYRVKLCHRLRIH